MAKFLDYTGLSYLWGKITTALASKQNTLTPGTNISISNDTISATDTWRSIRAPIDVGGSYLQELRDKPLMIVGNNISSDISTYSGADYLYINDTQPSDFDTATFSVTANHNTTTTFKSKTLPKGIYICVGCAQFASNATGFRSVSFNVNGANSDNYAFVMPAVSGAKTYTQISMIFNLTQTSNTVVFQGYQNSGTNSNLAVTGMFETIKIL